MHCFGQSVALSLQSTRLSFQAKDFKSNTKKKGKSWDDVLDLMKVVGKIMVLMKDREKYKSYVECMKKNDETTFSELQNYLKALVEDNYHFRGKVMSHLEYLVDKSH